MDIYKKDRERTLELFLNNCIKPKLFKELLQSGYSVKSIYNKYKNSNLDKLANLDVSIKILSDLDISYCCVWEPEYPALLAETYDPPIIIFYKGNFQIIKNNNFAVVGSRRMSDYGKMAIKKFIPDFQATGINIVSGMAAGIDAEAHKIAIENEIPTIAVLASSVAEPTPLYNKTLYEDILKHRGLIISEQFPGYPIHKGHFPRRNRIIAGLSIGTLVVEAHSTSGSLITARLAHSYGREVFALPDNIFNLNSIGCNRLIKNEKAKLVVESKDIFDELSLKNYYEEVIKTASLNENETIIYNSLKESSKTLEELANFLNLDFSVIISCCSIMEVRNLLQKNDQGKYYLK